MFEYPKLETPVLALYHGEWRILERRTDVPGFEDNYKEYNYWDDPYNEGMDINDLEVTKWQYIPNSDNFAKDAVVEANRELLLQRSNVGIQKYGTTLTENKGDLRYWLNHALEECLDQANYLQRAIMELDAKNGNR